MKLIRHVCHLFLFFDHFVNTVSILKFLSKSRKKMHQKLRLQITEMRQIERKGLTYQQQRWLGYNHTIDLVSICISFFPLAVETLGGWSALAIKTLKSVAILADARRSGSRDARVAPVRLLQSLSVCLMRGNATMIFSRAI